MQSSYTKSVHELNQATAAPLHAATDVGTVTLKVADLSRSLAFYNQAIGLQTLSQNGNTATLGAGTRPILNLEEVSGAVRTPRSATGLYHAAILFPDRRSLAIKIAQLYANNIHFGYSDHLVSEAFYLDDLDGNGLELYRDRPRSEWKWQNGTVQMANAAIDFDSFFAEIPQDDSTVQNPAAPAGTKLGHMHLRVANIAEAEKFYHGVLGFDIVAHMPSASFVSAGGYHHHIGMNTWESLGAKPAPEQAAGLREFSIVLPDQTEFDRLTKQIEAAGVAVDRANDSALVLDPFQNRIRFILQDSLAQK